MPTASHTPLLTWVALFSAWVVFFPTCVSPTFKQCSKISTQTSLVVEISISYWKLDMLNPAALSELCLECVKWLFMHMCNDNAAEKSLNIVRLLTFQILCDTLGSLWAVVRLRIADFWSEAAIVFVHVQTEHLNNVGIVVFLCIANIYTARNYCMWFLWLMYDYTYILCFIAL